MLFLTKNVIYYKKTIKSNIKIYNICISLFLLSNIGPVLLSVHPMFVSCVKAFWWTGKLEISKNSLSWRSIATLAASKSAAIRATTSWQRRLSNARNQVPGCDQTGAARRDKHRLCVWWRARVGHTILERAYNPSQLH